MLPPQPGCRTHPDPRTGRAGAGPRAHAHHARAPHTAHALLCTRSTPRARSCAPAQHAMHAHRTRTAHRPAQPPREPAGARTRARVFFGGGQQGRPGRRVARPHWGPRCALGTPVPPRSRSPSSILTGHLGREGCGCRWPLGDRPPAWPGRCAHPAVLNMGGEPGTGGAARPGLRCASQPRFPADPRAPTCPPRATGAARKGPALPPALSMSPLILGTIRAANSAPLYGGRNRLIDVVGQPGAGTAAASEGAVGSRPQGCPGGRSRRSGTPPATRLLLGPDVGANGGLHPRPRPLGTPSLWERCSVPSPLFENKIRQECGASDFF